MIAKLKIKKNIKENICKKSVNWQRRRRHEKEKQCVCVCVSVRNRERKKEIKKRAERLKMLKKESRIERVGERNVKEKKRKRKNGRENEKTDFGKQK